MFFRKLINSFGPTSPSNRPTPSSPPRRPLRLEPLEDRRMLSITLFVDDTSTSASPDGLAWPSAYPNLQSALDLAAEFNTDAIAENDVNAIWIAEGTYHPTAQLEPDDLRSATFSLLDGVSLYGGFIGTETTLAQRDLSSACTTLSGDLNANDATGIFGYDLNTHATRQDNAYTVVYGSEVNCVTLNGLAITGGNAGNYSAGWPSSQGSGGGMWISQSEVIIMKSVVFENYAFDGGGGISCRQNSSLTLMDSTILGNTSMHGGGIYSSQGTLLVTNSAISANTIGEMGGGICQNSGTLEVDNSVIRGNESNLYGGGIYMCHASAKISNSTISGNSTYHSGGGIYCNETSILSVNNSVVALNDTVYHNSENIGGLLANNSSHNIIDVDPKFIRNPSKGDDNQWGTDDDDYGDLRLQLGSPAVDAGDASLLPADVTDMDGDGDTTEPIPFDIEGADRVQGSAVNIGAYETFYSDNRIGPILYVDADAMAGDFAPVSSWEYAYADLQEAMDRAKLLNSDEFPENDVNAIWIAEGTYYPTAQLEPGDARSATFSLLDGVSLYGGFAGTETTLEERTLAPEHQTILSGDLGTQDDSVDNAYTVVYCGEGIETTLDGTFVIGGSGRYSRKELSYHEERVLGGGISSFGRLTVRNSTITKNDGGGIYSYAESGNAMLNVINCTIAENSVKDSGGGIYNFAKSGNATLSVTHSIISKNYIEGGVSWNSIRANGSGIYNYASLGDATATVTHSTIKGNSIKLHSYGMGGAGGGVFNYAESGIADLAVINSTVVGNSAEDAGGLYNRASTDAVILTITNSTIAGNYNGVYGSSQAVYNVAAEGCDKTLTIANTIFAYGNNYELSGSDIIETLSPASGHNLIGVDPKFIRNPFKGSDGLWGTDDDDYGDLRIKMVSPAIDAGDVSLLPMDVNDMDGDGDTSEPLPLDIQGQARIQGETLNIGAYETDYTGSTDYRIGPILYVDVNATPGTENLTSCWADAYTSLQEALDCAVWLNRDEVPENDVAQIWIAEGTYYPSAELEMNDTRTACFSLVEGVTLNGGFAGTETSLNQRDLQTHTTILSGDLGVAGDDSDNAFTVVYCNVTEAAIDGVSITGGNSHGGRVSFFPNLGCEGLYGGSYYVSPMMTGLSIFGGGVYNGDGGDLTLINIIVSDNFSSFGSGVYNSGDLKILDSVISNNSTDGDSGAIGNFKGDLIIRNTSIINNQDRGVYNFSLEYWTDVPVATMEIENSYISENVDGGVCNVSAQSILLDREGNENSGNIIASLAITNSLITGNHGSGVENLAYNDTNAILSVTNSTIANNSDYGISNQNNAAKLALRNSVMFGNDVDLYNYDATLLGSYNLIGDSSAQTALVDGVDGNQVGTSEFPIDPKFADPANGDYRLMASSPAVNAGSNALAIDQDGTPLEVDLDGQPRIQGGAVDIGAYESNVNTWGAVHLKLRDRTGVEELAWMDEWTGCWVEVWGQGVAATGIGGFDVELGFRSGCFTPDMTKVVPGGDVDGETLGVTVEEGEGKLRVTGSMVGDDVGASSGVMLAKIYFKPTPGESTLERDTDGHYLSPAADAGFYITEAKLVEHGTSTLQSPAIATQDAVPLWPVMYDLNGDGEINLTDVAQFVAVYQWNANENAPPMTWAADFDRSGVVDLTDLSHMLARYQWRKGDGNSVSYPDEFPFAESVGDGAVDGSDVTILAGNWQDQVNENPSSTWEMGDFNGDGEVDGSDVTILAGNWQYGVTAVAASVPASVSLCCTDAIFSDSSWNETDLTAAAKDLAITEEEDPLWLEDVLFDLNLELFDELE